MPASPGGACDDSEAAACPGLRSPRRSRRLPHTARLAEGRTEPDFEPAEPNDRAVVVVSRAIGRETPRGASSKARQPCVLIDPEKNGGFQTESRYFRRGLATKVIYPDCPGGRPDLSLAPIAIGRLCRYPATQPI